MGINQNDPKEINLANATFGGGCFWCVEAVFERLKGVKSAVSGYSGGRVENPSYKQICTGTTGHAEVCRIEYDPSIISYKELLEVFFYTHDPTTLNRQGNDVGAQYRSVILYHDDIQKIEAEEYIKELNEKGVWDNAVVTEISPLTKFYPAEDYHQDYYNNNPNQQYCRVVINPKLDKFRKKFSDKLSK